MEPIRTKGRWAVVGNITPGEARIGYRLFLSANGDIGQGELEAEVAQLGVPRISDRMYRHYRSLHATGYDHYIPINRFDVLQAAEPFGNESANSRYKYADIGLPVRVTVFRTQPFTFLGTADRVSDAGITVVIGDATTGKSLARGKGRLLIDELLRIDFLDGSFPTVDGRLVDRPEAVPDDEGWLLEIEFTRLRSVVEFTDGEPLQADVCPIRLQADDGGAVAADVLGRRLFHLLDAIENTRSMFNDVADREAPGFGYRASPAQVSHVYMDSPLEITVLIPLGVVSVLGIAWSLIKGGPVAYKNVQEGRLAGAQARRERASAESQEIDNELKRSIVRDAIRRGLESSGATLDDAGTTSRLFDNALDQLERNLDGFTREQVLGLELPAGAADSPPSDNDGGASEHDADD